MTRAEQTDYLTEQGWEEIAQNRWIKSEWWREPGATEASLITDRALSWTKAFEQAQLEEEFITM